MDLGLATILIIGGVIVTLGIGYGVYEYNSRKFNRGRWKTPEQKREEQ